MAGTSVLAFFRSGGDSTVQVWVGRIQAYLSFHYFKGFGPVKALSVQAPCQQMAPDV